MAQDETYQEDAGVKIWLASLTLLVLLIAGLFAVLVFYVGEIKEDNAAVIVQIDALNQRLDKLGAQMTNLQNDVTTLVPAQPAAAPAAGTPDVTATPSSPQPLLPQPDAGAAPANAPAPAIQTPALVAPPALAPSSAAPAASPHKP